MTFLLTLAAFTLLAAGTRRQATVIFSRPRPALRPWLLGGGYALLTPSLALALSGDDPARAVVAWIGELTVASVLVLLGCCLGLRA